LSSFKEKRGERREKREERREKSVEGICDFF
jgi:hypothetical protein